MARRPILAPKILQCCATPAGMSQVEVRAATQGKPATIATVLPALLRAGQLHRAGTRKNYRYFTHRAHATAYADRLPQHLEERARQRKEERRQYIRDRRAAKRQAQGLPPSRQYKAKQPKAAAPAKPRRSAKAGRASTLGPKQAGQSIAGATTVTWPAHVHVQRAPTPRDDRFAFVPPPGWRGDFIREWQQRRRA